MTTLIRNINQIKQPISFEGIENGKMHPSDIDAVLEFNNDILILFEVKRTGNEIPTGQRLLLERIVDSWKKEKAVALFVTHNFADEEPIILKDCRLQSYYHNKEWRTPTKQYNTIDFLNLLGRFWSLEKLNYDS